jgi:hypothetical protein
VRFFRLVARDIDVGPLLDEVHAQHDAWTANIVRQHRSPAQRHTQSILLRTAVQRSDLDGNENQECMDRTMARRFPQALSFMTEFGASMRATLSRAMIVRLKARADVSRHVDGGSYYVIRDRYHLVLFSASGSVLRSGDEEVRMWSGELWWFDNKQFHSAVNESDDWRIHYIFDLLPEHHAHLAVNPPPKET